MSTSNEIALEKTAAKKLITESARNYLTAKITLPLGNPELKKVHTNQFLFTALPKEFELKNWAVIANALNSGDTRFADYVINRWYVDGVQINVDANGKAEMDIDLNAFASSTTDYSEGRQSYETAYKDALSQNTTSSTSSTKKTSNAIAKNSTLKGGQGKTIDNLVKKICNGITDDLKKAKAIHEWLKKEVRYSRYCCAKYKNVDDCYKNRKHLNCADTATLTCRMMLSAGLKAYIVHRTHSNGHFWTVIEISGKKYASDQTGDGSNWNTIWYANGDRRTCNSSGGNWDRKNGDFPDCYPSYGC